ncbi:MAG TPA: AtpZ/AtpI family protein [Terriglobales bacterium]|nr:AtpZ/AtpI family protein [Terriglobales bacterium]
MNARLPSGRSSSAARDHAAGADSEAQRQLRHAVQRDVRRRRLGARYGDVIAAVAYLGTLGVAIAAPIVAGAFAGAWLDGRRAGYSSVWTLAGLIVGTVVGVLDAVALLRRQL